MNKFMNKKTIMGIALAGVIAAGAGTATMAAYKKNFTSANTITSAKFTVNSDKLTDKRSTTAQKEAILTLTGSALRPGIGGESKTFNITKQGTELPVKYDISITGTGDLFAANTPIQLKLLRCTNPTETVESNRQWQVMPSLNPTLQRDEVKDTEIFKLAWNWVENDNNDILFQGLSGLVNVGLVATGLNPTQEATITDKHELASAQCTFTWDNRLGGFGKFPNIEYYKSNGVKTLKVGDMRIVGTNAATHKDSIFEVKNLLLTKIEGTNQYKASCEGMWDGKIFTYTNNSGGMGVYYADFKVDYDHSLRIQTNNDVASWFQN
ncbi:MAG: hypothetical protein ACREV6_09245 [Clostridium sp.]|uniref:hypothetical protein n=1 Tax=Clostridium sp. TaxID=1506 RepID=UPI003D6D58D5